MTGHRATDTVIQQPSLQQGRGQVGAALWGTAGCGAPTGTDAKWGFCSFSSALFFFTFSLRETPEVKGRKEAARSSAPGQCSASMRPTRSPSISLSGQLTNCLSPPSSLHLP